MHRLHIKTYNVRPVMSFDERLVQVMQELKGEEWDLILFIKTWRKEICKTFVTALATTVFQAEELVKAVVQERCCTTNGHANASYLYLTVFAHWMSSFMALFVVCLVSTCHIRATRI